MNGVQFGFGNTKEKIELEPHIQIRTGKYDIKKIGSYTYLGGGNNTIIRNVRSIGRYCAIASNVNTGHMEHPTNMLSVHHMFHGKWDSIWDGLTDFYNEHPLHKEYMNYYNNNFPQEHSITIGNDVWIGEGVLIKRGITIGNGAIIGARSLVTKDVPPYAIVGGIPAKIIRYRFDSITIEKLNNIKWWEYDFNILKNVNMMDIKSAVIQMENNINNGIATKYNPNTVIFNPKNNIIS